MYELNTHNLKLYLLGLSIIFILTNGFPLLHMISDIEDRQHTKYSNVKGENFIIYYNKYYSLNATVIKHSIIYNTKTYNYAGNVILEYINYIDAHHYCKIDIPEHKFNDVIYNHIYKYYQKSQQQLIVVLLHHGYHHSFDNVAIVLFQMYLISLKLNVFDCLQFVEMQCKHYQMSQLLFPYQD